MNNENENLDDLKTLLYATSKDLSVKSLEEMNKKFYRPRQIGNVQLVNLLRSPYDNVDKLQDISQQMAESNGILKEFINYKALILTNDHYIYPTDAFKYKDKDSLVKDELKVANYLETFNAKHLIHWCTKRVLQNGEVYIYKNVTRNGVLMQEIPTKVCKIISLDEYGIFRYGVDMSKIAQEEVEYYPDEIKKGYKKFQGKGKKGKDFIGDFYIVGESGVAFQLNQWESKGLPYYMHLFKSLLNLEDAENLDNTSNELDNYKLLFQKALTDTDGKMLMDVDTVSLYHESVKSNTPKGIGVITSPMDVKPIALGDGKLKNYEHVNNLKKGVYDNAGIASDLFNGNAKTKESVLLSSIIDTLVPLEIQTMIERYLNFELMLKFKRGKWRVQFLPTSYYNRHDEIKLERENLAVYGSKKKYLAVQGFTPLESINILYAEEMLELQEQMKPMQTAHTISNKDAKNDEKDKSEEKDEDDEKDKKIKDEDDVVDDKEGEDINE